MRFQKQNSLNVYSARDPSSWLVKILIPSQARWAHEKLPPSYFACFWLFSNNTSTVMFV